MDRTHERHDSPSSPRTQDPLQGDWSEGIPGPLHAHALPVPAPLGWPSQAEVASAPTAPVTAEVAGDAAVEAPLDWGMEAAEVVEQPREPSTPSGEEDFPVTLSEADEIVDVPAAPVEADLAPAEWLVHPDADVAPASPGSERPAAWRGSPAVDEEPVATDTNMESAFAAAAEAAGAPPLAEPETPFSTEGETPFSAEPGTPFSPESGTPFSPEGETPPLREAEAEAPGPPPAPASAQTIDAWGEPTARTSEGPPLIEPWALPVDTPVPGTAYATRAGSGETHAADSAAAARSAGAAGELTEEPPQPDWSKGSHELFSPLPVGATLSEEGPETEPNGAGRESAGAASVRADRANPRQLELVREPAPQTLEDIDLLVPVDDVTPPEGVTPVEPIAPIESVAPPTPALRIAGEHRVAIHTRAGQTRRGTVVDLDLSQPQIALEPQGGGSTDTIDHSEVKAIFFMLAPGEKAEMPGGQAVRITFGDGRSIDGLRQGDGSPQGFFLVPLDAQRTNTRRIYVPRDAIAEMVDLR